MQNKFRLVHSFWYFIGFAMLLLSGFANADPPSRVARLGYISGPVSFSPAGENEWVRASVNRPLTTGDRLWVASAARAEFQAGGARVRMNANTSMSIMNLDDRIVQLRLSEGTLNVRVPRLERDQLFEVDTPNLAFTLSQPGEYRIYVDPAGYATDIFMRQGQGEAYGDGTAYIVDARQAYSFAGTDLRDYTYISTPGLDEFDRWSRERDRRHQNSISARYVSEDVVGFEELDTNGTWRNDPTYGRVWFPSRVSASWAPYRDGHWAWIDPWGWTWVDDAPWGFAVSHYGRWTNLRGSWGWVPGPHRERAYYAPALVAFVGGNNFQLRISSGDVGGIAWFPLSPQDVYRPSYAVSRGYFERVNVSNTVINNTVINNYYNNSNITNVVYANRSVPNAIIAVPTTAFVTSQQVSRAAVSVSREALLSRPVMTVPSMAPTAQSVRGAAQQSAAPPPAMFSRAVVARTPPPAAHASFVAQQQGLPADTGRPQDNGRRSDTRPATNAPPAPVVKIVAPAQVAPPTSKPPRIEPNENARGADRRSDVRRNDRSRGEAPVPPPATQQPRTTPTPAANQPAEQRDRSERVRGQPTIAPQNAVPAPVAPPQFSPPPAQQNSDQRGRSAAQNGKEEKPQPTPTTNARPQGVLPPAVSPSNEPRDRAEKPRSPAFAPSQNVAPAPVVPVAVPNRPGETQPEQRGRAPEPGAKIEQQRGRPLPPVAPPSGAPPAHEPKPVSAKDKDNDKGKGKGKDKDKEDQKQDDENKKPKD